MALDQLYQQLVLEHNRRPLNFGELDGATHSARGLDALCGDDILIQLKVSDGRVEGAAFSGEACAVTKASASMMTEWLKGREVKNLVHWFDQFSNLLGDDELPDVAEFGEMNQLRAVGQFRSRVRNAQLPWETALQALELRGRR